MSWLLAILLWGTSKVLSAHYDEEFYANEDKRQPPDKEYSTRWEFGQVLPVLLLAAPLVAIIGTFTSSEKSSKGSRSEDRLEVASSSFENTASSYHRPQQSEGDTWELRTLSTRGRSSAERQNGNDLNYDDSVSVEHSVNQNQGINSRNVFARDYYSEALWMLPYMVVSFMMIWAYIFFLFWYATDAFLVMGRYDNGPAGKMSDSVDYLFDHTTGVFYLILVSYPAAGYSFILFGLTVDEWKKAPRTTLRRFSRSMLSWLWALGSNALYASFIYYLSGVEKNSRGSIPNETRFQTFSYITGGLCAVYILACLFHSTTRWIKACCRKKTLKRRR